MKRRVIGLYPSMGALTCAETMGIAAWVVLPLWYACAATVAAAGLLMVTVHRRSAPMWGLAALRWGGARRRTMTVPEAVDVVSGEVICGVRIDAYEAVAMIALHGRAHRPTYLRGSTVAITDDVVPLSILADALEQPGGLQLSIDVVSAGARVRRSGGYPALYSTLLAARPAAGRRASALVVRMDIPASSTGLGYRTSVGAALAAAAERIVCALRQDGVRAAALNRAQLDIALAERSGGLLSNSKQESGNKKRGKPTLRWHSVKTAHGYCATYYLTPEAITTAALARLWSLHTDGVATTVTLRKVRGVLQATALVQVVTAQPPTQPPALNLHTLPGDQLAALAWSAPSARMRLAVPFATLGGELRLPIGPCGVLVGAMMRDDPMTGARRDDFVTLPLTDPVSTTRVSMDVADSYVRALLMRAAAVGERIIIHTNSPDTWTGLADPNIAIARGGRAPFVPTIIVNDHAVNVPAQGLASTMITLGNSEDADITFRQLDDSTVRVSVGELTVDVVVIKFRREQGWTG